MIEKPVFPHQTGLRWRVGRPPLIVSVAATIGAGLLTVIIETTGTIPELPIATQNVAPVPIDPAETKGLRSTQASDERLGSGRITDLADRVQIAKTISTGPGGWLIDDVAKVRAKPQVRQAGSDPLPIITATVDTHIEARVGSRSSDDTRASADEHVPGPLAPSARTDMPRELDDADMSCVKAPVSQTPEGKHWYYRLDGEDHHKCWYVRARRHEASRRSNQHLRSRRTWTDWRPWYANW